MAKKHKKTTNTPPAPRPDEGELNYNPFADIKDRVKAARKAEAARQPAPAPAPPRRAEPTPPPAPLPRPELTPRPRGAVEMSAEELFASMVDGIGRADLERGKYGGVGPDTSKIRVREERALAPAEVKALDLPDDPYHDEAAFFEDLMGRDGVQPVSSNLHVHAPGAALNQDAFNDASFRPVASADERGVSPASRDALLDDLEREGGPTLSTTQRQLLREIKRLARAGTIIPTTNIRGESREVALARAEEAVHAASLAGTPYVRVITGKGLQSEDRPVLKRAVVDWCLTRGEHLVIAWAPEVEADGSFGAVVLQVRRQQRRRV